MLSFTLLLPPDLSVLRGIPSVFAKPTKQSGHICFSAPWPHWLDGTPATRVIKLFGFGQLGTVFNYNFFFFFIHF